MFMIYLQAKREQTWNEKDSHLKKKKKHMKIRVQNYQQTFLDRSLEKL